MSEINEIYTYNYWWYQYSVNVLNNKDYKEKQLISFEYYTIANFIKIFGCEDNPLLHADKINTEFNNCEDDLKKVLINGWEYLKKQIDG